MAVAAIIKAEDIQVTDEDVEAEYQKLAEQYGMELEMVKKYLPADQTKDQLANQKAVAIVVESATATKPEKKKAAKKTEGAEDEEKPAKKSGAKKASKPAEDAAEGEEKPAKKATAKKTSKKTEKEGE